MIPNPFRRIRICFILLAGQTTLFSDNFDGGTGNIHSLAPDIRPGSETWTAAPVFNAAMVWWIARSAAIKAA